MDTQLDALAFGEILYDVFEDGAYLGGAPLNFAWYMKQMGVSVGMVSAVGKDGLGRQALRVLDEAGIQHGFVSVLDQPTGTVDVKLTNGQPNFIINTGVAWDQIDTGRFAVPQSQMLYFGSLAQRTEVNRRSLASLIAQQPRYRFFDVNLRQSYYDRVIILNGLRDATMVKLNEDELVVLEQVTDLANAEQIAQKYELAALVVTRGADGASLYVGPRRYDAVAPKVDMVDAVGAGDAFSAVMAVAQLRGVPLEQALPIACEAGAMR